MKTVRNVIMFHNGEHPVHSQTQQAVSRARQQCCSSPPSTPVTEQESGQAADLWPAHWAVHGEGKAHPLGIARSAFNLQISDEADEDEDFFPFRLGQGLGSWVQTVIIDAVEFGPEGRATGELLDDGRPGIPIQGDVQAGRNGMKEICE